MLAKARLPEGVAGIARLHAMIGEQLGEDAEDRREVVVGIETDRGPWVQALVAAGYAVFAVNPLQAARYRERLGVSGAKSDAGDAHVLADMVRTDSHQLRPVAGDSAEARGGQGRRPGAQDADLGTHPAPGSGCGTRCGSTSRPRWSRSTTSTPPTPWSCWPRPPTPARRPRLTHGADHRGAQARPSPRHRRRRPRAIQAALRTEHLGQPAVVTAAYAASVRALVAVLTTLNEQIKTLEGQVEAHFGQHPDAEIYLLPARPGRRSSAPGCSPSSATTPDRYAAAKARKNYAGTSPITRASGKKKTVLARYVHNDRLIDALMAQAFAALHASPGARAYYDQLRARGAGHHAALRQLGQPARRHPARLPQDRHPLRRGHRLVPPRPEPYDLTHLSPGMSFTSWNQFSSRRCDHARRSTSAAALGCLPQLRGTVCVRPALCAPAALLDGWWASC